MSCSSPPGDDAGARDVHQGAADLRRCPRDGGDLIDVVGAARAGIDPAGHAVLQEQRRPFLAAAGMGVDVDQARGDDLAARIDRFGGVARDVGLDRGDLAAGDRHVADRIEPDRGIDDAPALDDQIIGRRERLRNAGEHRSTGGAGGDNWRLFIMVDSPSVPGSSIVSPEAARAEISRTNPKLAEINTVTARFRYDSFGLWFRYVGLADRLPQSAHIQWSSVALLRPLWE